MLDAGSSTISDNTRGSLETFKMSLYFGCSDASVNAWLISSLVAFLEGRMTKSERLPTGVGTRNDVPSNLPLSDGMAWVAEIAAPVVVGIMLMAAARARRRSLALPPGGGPSTRFCSAV